MRSLLGLPVVFLLIACATNQPPGTAAPGQQPPPGQTPSETASDEPREPSLAETLAEDFARDTTRAAGAEVQRALPRTGYWPVDRLFRRTTSEARSTVDDVIWER